MRLRRVLFAATALVALLVAAQAHAQGDSPPLAAPGRLIDIGGWRLHLNCTGTPQPARPTVLLEAGIGDFSVEWSLVQPRTAEFARVCSYDRAGSGWSDMGPLPRTMKQIVFELHALLTRADVRPPYLLVGQSYGGVLVRLFTSTYPNEVSGMVLVDGGRINPMRLVDGKLVSLPDVAKGTPIPSVRTDNPLRDENIPAAARQQIEIGAQQAAKTANQPPRDKLPPDAQRMRTWALAQVKHYVAYGPGAMQMEAEELALMVAAERENPQPLKDKPLIVLTAGRNEFRADEQSLEDDRLKNQAGLVRLSSNGKQIVVRESGHHIHIEQPDVVVQAIRDALASVR